MMDETKFCINCKYCDHREKTWWEKITGKYLPPAEFSKCQHPISLTILQNDKTHRTLVDGIDRREYTYCSIMRGKYSGAKLCGPNAMLFEPKE